MLRGISALARVLLVLGARPLGAADTLRDLREQRRGGAGAALASSSPPAPGAASCSASAWSTWRTAADAARARWRVDAARVARAQRCADRTRPVSRDGSSPRPSRGTVPLLVCAGRGRRSLPSLVSRRRCADMLLLAQGSRWRRRRRPAARGGQSHGSNRTAAASGGGGLPLGDARRYIDATRDFRLPRAEGETDLSGGCADYAGWPRDADEREGGGATSAAAAAAATSCD